VARRAYIRSEMRSQRQLGLAWFWVHRPCPERLEVYAYSALLRRLAHAWPGLTEARDSLLIVHSCHFDGLPAVFEAREALCVPRDLPGI
jgi:hypothetical protein